MLEPSTLRLLAALEGLKRLEQSMACALVQVEGSERDKAARIMLEAQEAADKIGQVVLGAIVNMDV